MNEWLQLIGGGFLLYLGAEWLVGGASALARALRVPQIIMGLTVVAYGTSAPEIIVGIQAAGAGHSDVALGNVIGSNIANIGLILGLAALVRPAHVDSGLQRRELPILLASAAIVPWARGVVHPNRTHDFASRGRNRGGSVRGIYDGHVGKRLKGTPLEAASCLLWPYTARRLTQPAASVGHTQPVV